MSFLLELPHFRGELLNFRAVGGHYVFVNSAASRRSEELVSSLKAVRQGWKRHVRVRFHVSFPQVLDVPGLFVVGG